MDFPKVMQAVDECEQMIQSHTVTVKKSAQLEHCLDMIRRMRAEFSEGKLGKAFRWLGFIQGVMYAHGVADIETLKRMNAPDEAKS
jgi:hypothetical protein